MILVRYEPGMQYEYHSYRKSKTTHLQNIRLSEISQRPEKKKNKKKSGRTIFEPPFSSSACLHQEKREKHQARQANRLLHIYVNICRGEMTLLARSVGGCRATPPYKTKTPLWSGVSSTARSHAHRRRRRHEVKSKKRARMFSKRQKKFPAPSFLPPTADFPE